MSAPAPATLRCSVYLAVSLDGYIARADGGLDWLSAVELEGEDYGFQAFLDSVDTLVLGRSTYEVVRDFEPWPYAGKRCVVLSHRPLEPRHGEEAFAGSPAELVERLCGQGARRAYVDGGATVRQFLAAGLVDDLTLSVIPILLGDGIPLFDGGVPETRLVLDGSQSWSSGLCQLRYRVSRDS